MISSLTTLFVPGDDVRPELMTSDGSDVQLLLSGPLNAGGVTVGIYGEREHIAALLRQALAVLATAETTTF